MVQYFPSRLQSLGERHLYWLLSWLIFLRGDFFMTTRSGCTYRWSFQNLTTMSSDGVNLLDAMIFRVGGLCHVLPFKFDWAWEGNLPHSWIAKAPVSFEIWLFISLLSSTICMKRKSNLWFILFCASMKACNVFSRELLGGCALYWGAEYAFGGCSCCSVLNCPPNGYAWLKSLQLKFGWFLQPGLYVLEKGLLYATKTLHYSSSTPFISL